MKKRSKKVEIISSHKTSYTDEELEQMATDLVNRGLASKAILEHKITKKSFQRSERFEYFTAFERG